MKFKRLTLMAGHYGSGKTNIAVNLAMMLKKAGEDVVIADLDIVNPYYRTSIVLVASTVSHVGPKPTKSLPRSQMHTPPPSYLAIIVRPLVAPRSIEK